ncbi:MAG: tyrosine-type recombinase/integrase [Actinomycetota bacterium]
MDFLPMPLTADTNGRQKQPKWLYERFKSAQRGSGLPYIHLHQARHTAVTWQLSEGTPLHIVSGRTGHSQSSTTANIYAHFLPQQDSQASLTIGYALDQAIKNAKQSGSKNEKKVARR